MFTQIFKYYQSILFFTLLAIFTLASCNDDPVNSLKDGASFNKIESDAQLTTAQDNNSSCNVAITINNIPSNNTLYIHCENNEIFSLNYSFSGGFPYSQSSYSFQIRIKLNGTIIAYNPNTTSSWNNGWVSFQGYGNLNVSIPKTNNVLRVELSADAPNCTISDEKSYTVFCYYPATPFMFGSVSPTGHPRVTYYGLTPEMAGPISQYEIWRSIDGGAWQLYSIRPTLQYLEESIFDDNALTVNIISRNSATYWVRARNINGLSVPPVIGEYPSFHINGDAVEE